MMSTQRLTTWGYGLMVSVLLHVVIGAGIVLLHAFFTQSDTQDSILKPGEQLTWLDLTLADHQMMDSSPINPQQVTHVSSSARGSKNDAYEVQHHVLENSSSASNFVNTHDASTFTSGQVLTGQQMVANTKALKRYIRDQIHSRILHSARAMRLKGQGNIEMQVLMYLSPTGQLSKLSLLKSSGSSALDQIALAIMQRAEPYPYLPGEIVVPLVF